MASRGETLCAPARICNAVSCEKYLFKDKADTLGITHCKCGRPFTHITYKPLPKGGNRSSSRAQEGPSAKARAKAKAGAKARAQAKPKAAPRRPWQPPQGDTSSPTGQRSGGGDVHVHRVDPRRAADTVYTWTALQEYTKEFPLFSELHGLAEKNLQCALAQKAQAMPPTQRVDHLKKRLKVETEELRKRTGAVVDTEAELQNLRERLKLAVEGRDAQAARVQQLEGELQQAEAALPTTTAGPKPVGRQVQDSDQEVVDLLNLVHVKLNRKAISGRMTTDQWEEYIQYDKGIRLIDKELTEERQEREDQEAADSKLAFEMQKREVQLGKHARDDFAHDAGGDAHMGAKPGDAENDGFQQRRSRCRRGRTSGPAARTLSPTRRDSPVAPVEPAVRPARGRVPVCPPGRKPESGDPSATSSATPQPSVAEDKGPLGPLATVPRARTDRGRDSRSPRRPAAGTPANPQAKGSLGAGRDDEVMTSEVSSLTSKPGSREASPAAGGTGATVQTTAATGLASEDNQGATEQPNQGGGASAYT